MSDPAEKTKGTGSSRQRNGSIRGKIVGGYAGLYLILSLLTVTVMGAAAYLSCYYTVREQARQTMEQQINSFTKSLSEDVLKARWPVFEAPDYVEDFAVFYGDTMMAAARDHSETDYLERLQQTRCDNPLLSLGWTDFYMSGIIRMENAGNQRYYGRIFMVVNVPLYISQIPYDGQYFLFIPAAAAILFVFGLIITLLFGSSKTRRFLSPIREVTDLTRQISAQNLNVRLNAETARYELREMVLTINDMLDRVHAGMAKQKAFVSDVSHELRTPLSVINGYAHILERWAREDEKVFEESVTAIINESENMKYLVENLLLLVRSDNNTLVFDRETFDLSVMLHNIHKETVLIDGTTHHIHADIEDGVLIHGDRAKLKQALRVFVENALKYTPPDGSIYLSLGRTGDGVRITIRDTGIGISKKDLGHVFVRFYRGDRSRSRQTGGYGLGLPIARTILTAHSGRIRMSSREGVGTTVDVLLPAAGLDEGDAAKKQPKSSPLAIGEIES